MSRVRPHVCPEPAQIQICLWQYLLFSRHFNLNLNQCWY